MAKIIITLLLLFQVNTSDAGLPREEFCLKSIATITGLLNEKEIAAAFSALEAAHYKVSISIFQKDNPILNNIISQAVDRPITMDTLFRSLPKQKSVVAVRNKLLGVTPAPEETSIPRKSAFKNSGAKVKREEAIVNVEEKLEQKKWLKGVLKSLVQNGIKPNFANISQESEGNAILSATQVAYNGSLYDAVADAELNTQGIFTKTQNDENLTDWIKRMHLVGKAQGQHKTLEDISEAVSMEFPFPEMHLARSVVLKLLEGETSLANLAFACNSNIEKIKSVLEFLTQNVTLEKFLKLILPRKLRI
jgi:hypothetical protein